MTRLNFDPALMPVVSVANDDAVPASRLTPDALRRRFASDIDWHAEDTLEHRLRSDNLDAKPAAVLVPLVIHASGITVMLTRRAAHLNDHAGQISFPGGRCEPSDRDAAHTALRESYEEVGLAAEQVEVLGILPDYLTATGYRVTPVVGLVASPIALKPDPQEVAEVFEVPLAFLMAGANHERRQFGHPSLVQGRIFYAMPYRDYFIWGATAGMLRNLYHFLRAGS